MRKIEQAMIAAIESDRAFQRDNTLVTMASLPLGGYKFKVFLHGNKIAQIERSTLNNSVSRVEFSFAGWQTPTTKSRIKAALSVMSQHASVYQKKGELYFRCRDTEVALCANGWYAFDGMILQRLYQAS